MTVPDPIGPDAAMLPGLDLVARPVASRPTLERTAIAQVQRLIDAGRIGPDDEILVGLVLDLARTVGLGAAAGKAAGVAMAGRQLLDALDKLPRMDADDGGDDWGQLVAALSATDDVPVRQ